MDREVVINDSSHIARLGYDKESSTLVVQFTSTFVYRYTDVKPLTFGTLCAADSVGVAFNTLVRGDKSIGFSQLGGWPEGNGD
jgi:hypothetical protein